MCFSPHLSLPVSFADPARDPKRRDHGFLPSLSYVWSDSFSYWNPSWRNWRKVTKQAGMNLAAWETHSAKSATMADSLGCNSPCRGWMWRPPQHQLHGEGRGLLSSKLLLTVRNWAASPSAVELWPALQPSLYHRTMRRAVCPREQRSSGRSVGTPNDGGSLRSHLEPLTVS